MFKPYKLSILTLGLAAGVALALPASAQQAKEPKQKKQVTAQAPQRPNSAYRGTDQVQAGPLYYQGYYLGDDPDPAIRLQIMRDLGARFPGAQ